MQREVLFLLEAAEELQGEVGDAPCNQRAYGYAVEEDDSCHGADDEGRDHIGTVFQEVNPAAAGQSRQQSCYDGDDASVGAEGIYHGIDGDGAIGYGQWAPGWRR